MKPITIYTANCRENPLNNRYPNRHVITNTDELKAAACFDQVFAAYRNNHRSKADFITSDCLPFDCDNDHSEDPEDWKTASDVEKAFPGVPFYLIYSRHHMKRKDKYSPRPRFHIIFPIDPVNDSDEYSRLKDSVIAFFPYFDTNAKDAARFFFGVKNPVVEGRPLKEAQDE